MYKWIYFSGLAVALILAGVLVSAGINYGRTDAWLERAQTAGNPAQASEFLLKYKEALNENGLVEGQYYTIWKYPATSMDVHIRVIDALIERGQQLSRQAATDESYQMGLINFEKDLGDMDARAFSVWFANGGFIVANLVLMFGLFAVFGWVPLVLMWEKF